MMIVFLIFGIAAGFLSLFRAGRIDAEGIKLDDAPEKKKFE